MKKIEDFDSAEEYIAYLEKLVEDLQESDRVLTALEGAGVDNWEGYDNAIEMMEAME